MKQTTRLLALSALVLAVMLAVLGVPALEAPGVAHAQGTVPAAPTNLSAQRSADGNTITLSWTGVNGAARYQVYSWDETDGWTRLDGGADNPHTTTTFSHTGLTANRLYYYQVYAVNAQGDRGPRSNRVNEVAGREAPDRPVLTATAGYLVNVISWPAVSGATSYELYAWDQSWSQVGGTITGTSYQHTGLTAGKTYYYEARAVKSATVKSAYSAQVNAIVLSTPTVTAPVNLSAGTTPQDQQVTLTWQSPPGAGAAITGYQYRYAESSAALPDTWTDAGMDMTETITGLTNGTQYTFEVRAMSSTGEGPAASVMATPAAVPDAPVLTATPGYRQVMLSWDAPADNGADISAYRIELLNAQNQWVRESSQPGTATTYTDSGLNDSAVYTYRIIAINAAGDSSASNSADATTLAQPAQAPGTPTGFSATAGAGKVDLAWAAPLFNGGSPVTRYDYRYKVTTASSYGSWMSAGTALKAAVTSLTPATEYSFQVRAVNAAGMGDPTDAATATPTATGPTAVPVLRTPVVGTHAGTVEAHESNATITLSWAALPASANGGEAISGYEFCYKKSTDSAWMRWDGTGFSTITAPVSGSVWTAVHGAAGALLEPGTMYQYRARALNSIATAGSAATCTHWDGDWSAVVSATTPVVKPNAPVLAASTEWVRNVNSITIKWAAPTVKGGADLTAYEVWVGTATVTAPEDVAALKPTVINLPPSRLEYISIGLTSATEYFYRVRARNGSGDGRVGAWSTEVSGETTVTQAGTPGKPDAPTVPNTSDTGNVAITWTPPTDLGTSPITKYEVQYQRTDDFADQDLADTAADLAEWGDAMLAMPSPPAALTWTHMEAPGDSDWVYRVRAVNSSGEGEWSDASSAVDVVARPPSKPTLTASALGMDEIMLRWNIPEDNGTPITGFEIVQWEPGATPAAWGTDNLLAPTGGTDLSSDATLTVFAVTGLEGGTKYYFRIRATTDGTAGVWSAENMADAASATTMSGMPAKPVITATKGTGDDADSITITWTKPGSGGSDITGYQLRIYDGTTWAMEASPAAGDLMYKDEDLPPGERQYYILAARNSMGYGPWSAPASDMTHAGNPDAPTLMATPTGADSIQLTWNVPDANGATITGYQLLRWDNGDPGAWGTDNLLTGAALANADAVTVTEFEDTGLDAGTKYYYRIRALPQLADDRTTPDAAAGWSATDTSDATSATTHGDTPQRPTDLAVAVAATNPTTSLTLTWTAPTITGGSDITGYEVQIRSGGRWVDEATPTAATYTDTGLDVGTKYYYRVRAVNSQGGGLWSAYASGTTTAANPDAPVLTATATGMETIRLTWTVPDDNGTAITGYVLQRFGTSAWDTATNLLGAVPEDTIELTLHVDADLDPGKTYHYRIRATPQTGDNDGWSVSKSATTVAGAPDRPTMVTAEADGQNAVDLTWVAPASDNGSAIVRYELQRYTTASGWVTVRSDLPSTRTNYKDSGLTADTRYVYRLRAVNRAEHNSGFGKFSTIVFVKTDK